MIELLSPAGSMEALYAAIEGGCDAVYLGGILFGARAYANNFDNESIIKAINYAHLYGVKVYVTTNILIYEHEVDNFLKYVEFLHKNNVDALIIQDLGMLDLVHKTFPNLELHASTQMHIHNLDGALMAKKLGVKRVVLARETSIEKVKEIRKKALVDVEIFAHGALCASYSGQCLFSSLIGNRSGNRGSCAQSCRLPYDICSCDGKKINKEDYPLSMKDLNTLSYVGELIEANVTSLKIEGRMKSAEYVYAVTKLYREAIDSYYKNGVIHINDKLFNNLQKIFSRKYTKGYLFNENMDNILSTKRPNHQGISVGRVIEYNNYVVKVKLTDEVSINDGLRIILNDEDYGMILNQFYKNNVLIKNAFKGDIVTFKVNKPIPVNSEILLTKDDSLNKEIDNIIKSNYRKVMASITVNAYLNKPLELMINDGDNLINVKGNNVIEAINNVTKKEDIISKIIKLGNTIYKENEVIVNMDNNIFIPLSEINNLRKEAILQLNRKRLYKIPFKKEMYTINLNDYNHEKLRAALVKNKIEPGYDVLYSDNLENTIIKVPRVMEDYLKYNPDNLYLVGELGALNCLTNVITDFSFNVVNSYTVALLHSLGVKRITLSYELSDTQIKNLIGAYVNRYHKNPNLELVVYGKLEVMVLKTNLNKIYKENDLFLKDRYNNYYRIESKNDYCYIYDYKKRSIYNESYYDMGINCLRDNL